MGDLDSFANDKAAKSAFGKMSYADRVTIGANSKKTKTPKNKLVRDLAGQSGAFTMAPQGDIGVASNPDSKPAYGSKGALKATVNAHTRGDFNWQGDQVRFNKVTAKSPGSKKFNVKSINRVTAEKEYQQSYPKDLSKKPKTTFDRLIASGRRELKK